MASTGSATGSCAWISRTVVSTPYRVPACLKEDGIYKMWYSYRGQSYRIGYAESADGIRWERKDDLVGLDVSTSGWDSEMIEYPFVFDHGSRRYMLYNGNGFGRSGLGLAVLDKSVSG